MTASTLERTYSYGLNTYGPYSYGPYSYGLYSYGLYTYGLFSYGLFSYGLYSYGLYSYGRECEDNGQHTQSQLRPVGTVVRAVGRGIAVVVLSGSGELIEAAPENLEDCHGAGPHKRTTLMVGLPARSPFQMPPQNILFIAILSQHFIHQRLSTSARAGRRGRQDQQRLDGGVN